MARKKGCSNKEDSNLVLAVNDSLFYEKKDLYILCKVCKCHLSTVKGLKMQMIKRHEKTEKHKNNLNYILNKNENLAYSNENTADVHKNLVKTLLRCNIPLNVVDSEDFKSFFESSFNFHLLSRETYRSKFFKILEEEEREKVLSIFKNTAFTLYLDETIDSRGLKILNVLGMPLNGKDEKIILIDSIKIEKTNAETILSELLFILPKLIGERKNKFLFKALVTDGAPYCVKLGKMIKNFYPDVKHINCLCHNLNLLAEKLRLDCGVVNLFISELKHILIKNRTNMSIFLRPQTCQ